MPEPAVKYLQVSQRCGFNQRAEFKFKYIIIFVRGANKLEIYSNQSAK